MEIYLTDKEKEFLKLLLKIGETLSSSETSFSAIDTNYDKFNFSDVWNLATKLGIDL